MSELHHDDYSIDTEGPKDIDVSRMVTNGQPKHDFTVGDPQNFNDEYEKYCMNTTTFSATTSKGRP